MADDRTRYTVSIKRPDFFFVSAKDIDDLKMIAIETQMDGERGTLPALTFAYWGMIALQMPEFRRFCDSYHELGFDFVKEPERLLDYLTKNPPDSWVKAAAH